MLSLPKLPLRQKIYLSLTILTGLFILIASYWEFIGWESLHTLILFYGICIPTFLLADETIIDLNDKQIFKIWSTIALIFFTIYVLTQNKYFVSTKAPNIKSATKSFKALPLFLMFYWILNEAVKKRTGHFIINTFSQNTWYNYAAKRNIRWFDILTNILLLIVIVLAGVIDF